MNVRRLIDEDLKELVRLNIDVEQDAAGEAPQRPDAHLRNARQDPGIGHDTMPSPVLFNRIVTPLVTHHLDSVGPTSDNERASNPDGDDIHSDHEGGYASSLASSSLSHHGIASSDIECAFSDPESAASDEETVPAHVDPHSRDPSVARSMDGTGSAQAGYRSGDFSPSFEEVNLDDSDIQYRAPSSLAGDDRQQETELLRQHLREQRLARSRDIERAPALEPDVVTDEMRTQNRFARERAPDRDLDQHR